MLARSVEYESIRDTITAAHAQSSQSDRLTVAGLLANVIDKKAPARAAGRADKATVKDCLQKLGWVHRRTGQQSDRWVLEN